MTVGETLDSSTYMGELRSDGLAAEVSFSNPPALRADMARPALQ